MKNLINSYLCRLGIEIHGTDYIQKLKRFDLNKNEWIWQKELLKGKANVIFDVGANRGNTTLKYLKVFPNAIIHSFEPFPDSYELFINLHKGNLNVKLNKYALSNDIGKSILNINKSIDTNSFLESIEIGANSDKGCVSVGRMLVETNTLDNYCSKNNINAIDILKIDVQGYEMEVLRGAVEMLNNGRIKLIYIETYFKPQYLHQPLFHDISKLLYDYNFLLNDVYDPYFSNNNMIWCDSIFINANSI